MPGLGPSEWTVADVCEWLTQDLELPDSVVATFKENAIAGPDLLELSDEDLKEELGCKPLQARKIRSALTKMGFGKAGSSVTTVAVEPAPTAAAVVAAMPAAAPAPAEAPPAAAPPPAPAAYPLPSGYPAPVPGGYPPSGVPPPAYYGPLPAAPPPQESQKDHTGRKVAAAVLLTRPNRMMRRGFMMNN